MTDDKIVDLRTVRRGLRTKADEKTMAKVWAALGQTWTDYAEEVKNRQAPDELCLSSDPSAVFSVMLENVVAMAKAANVDNNFILETLLEIAIIECEPKGRLYQLLNKASNLLEYGDEDAWEKMVLEMHAAGKLSDDELARELEGPK